VKLAITESVICACSASIAWQRGPTNLCYKGHQNPKLTLKSTSLSKTRDIIQKGPEVSDDQKKYIPKTYEFELEVIKLTPRNRTGVGIKEPSIRVEGR
jgi:hypothetical protein